MANFAQQFDDALFVATATTEPMVRVDPGGFWIVYLISLCFVGTLLTIIIRKLWARLEAGDHPAVESHWGGYGGGLGGWRMTPSLVLLFGAISCFALFATFALKGLDRTVTTVIVESPAKDDEKAKNVPATAPTTNPATNPAEAALPSTVPSTRATTAPASGPTR